ncbi:PH1107-like glycosidase [Caldivirga maquilingensis]|uniref:Glycosidase PH1107-related n=1 Tax=Caldivirga maquilingensis (strain ATCC 700844 / DSM 13496 / JCM 10307 / IC-167) TaxID=397948 RepID=A8MA25_CALMQ|nr:PH1107-like glycosidase [Caldivirga maquilingensis]ABW00957.1 glycosidase PH1107-related [Caldivirga maquilingensis IC-167]
MENTIIGRLRELAVNFINVHKGFRRSIAEPIFKRITLIMPSDVNVTNYPRKPVEVFNPAAVLNNDTLLIFPRIIFDYLNYVSSIGLIELSIRDVVNGRVNKPVNARLIMWPRELWEFRGCEDPRIIKHGDEYLILYTGWGYYYSGGELRPRAVQALAVMDNEFNVVRRGFFTIKAANGESYVPDWWKDSAFIEVKGNKVSMLIRPNIGGLEIGWSGEANLSELTLNMDSMRPVLWFEDFEFKVGWSTNAVKLSSNEYLVGWHGVSRSDYSYRNGLALVNSDGELLAISNYLLEPTGIEEEYGDRPRVIFGDGLIIHEDSLIWIGGVSDYAIGVYTVELDKALSKLTWLKG